MPFGDLPVTEEILMVAMCEGYEECLILAGIHPRQQIIPVLVACNR